MHQQLWGCKVEEKMYLAVRERRGLNIMALEDERYRKASLQQHKGRKHMHGNQ